MNEIAIIDELHGILKNNFGDQKKLRNAVGRLIIKWDKDIVFSALLECAIVAYARVECGKSQDDNPPSRATTKGENHE